MEIKIKETNLKPDFYLNERNYTDMIVIHHTGERDIDASAAEIDQWHKANGWAMIGYHFVIRKDGTIERGRPEYAVGSHAYGENYHTLGIHLSGDFMIAKPTDSQIDSCISLIAYLCDKYDILCDDESIVGHCDLMPTDCPGKYLYNRIPDIIDKVIYYTNHRDDPPQDKPFELDAKVVNVISIHSQSPIDDSTINNIIDILKNSNCPNETLKNSIKDFNRIEGNQIYIGSEDNYIYYV